MQACLRQNSIREPLVEWPIPSLDIPLYCSFLTQPNPTIYDVTFGFAHYNREFRVSMGLPAEPAGRELGKSLEDWVEDVMEDKEREVSDWSHQELKWARQSAARCTGDMLDALWLRYFYDGDENVLRKILEVATSEVSGPPGEPKQLMQWLMINQSVDWEGEDDALLISVHSALRSLIRVMTEHGAARDVMARWVEEKEGYSQGAARLGMAMRYVEGLPSTSQQMPPAYRMLMW